MHFALRLRCRKLFPFFRPFPSLLPVQTLNIVEIHVFKSMIRVFVVFFSFLKIVMYILAIQECSSVNTNAGVLLEKLLHQIRFYRLQSLANDFSLSTDTVVFLLLFSNGFYVYMCSGYILGFTVIFIFLIQPLNSLEQKTKIWEYVCAICESIFA